MVLSDADTAANWVLKHTGVTCGQSLIIHQHTSLLRKCAVCSKYDVTTDNWKLRTAELGATLERWRTAACGTPAKIFNIWVQQRNYAERERKRERARCTVRSKNVDNKTVGWSGARARVVVPKCP